MITFKILSFAFLLRVVYCNDEDNFVNIRLTCHRSSYMVSIEKHETNFVYLGGVYENKTARSLGECVSFCIKSDDCESLNFWKTESLCQLNSDAIYEMGQLSYLYGGKYRQLGETHQDSLGGCHGDPCQNGATCTEICDGSARYYECTCATGYEGYDCDSAMCYTPSAPTYGYISGSYTYPVSSGTQIQMSCDNSWYSLSGSSTVTCNQGSWTASPTCTRCSGVAVGCESGAIPDNQITASSNWAWNHYSSQGRINYARGGYSYAWCSGSNSVGQWLQVDIGSNKMVTQVATQGRGDASQWVTAYKLYYGDTSTWAYVYEDNGSQKVFSGNWNSHTIVYHALGDKSFIGRYVRFVVQSWYSHMSMRVEVYACTG
ncbi:uncharacterized protein LOC144438733 [Glandiceps talaboti]